MAKYTAPLFACLSPATMCMDSPLLNLTSHAAIVAPLPLPLPLPLPALVLRPYRPSRAERGLAQTDMLQSTSTSHANPPAPTMLAAAAPPPATAAPPVESSPRKSLAKISAFGSLVRISPLDNRSCFSPRQPGSTSRLPSLLLLMRPLPLPPPRLCWYLCWRCWCWCCWCCWSCLKSCCC